ncbi:sel1 repeat family protein [Pseudomonas sp. 119P]|uniref:Sel1 repeat family protein n=2 Tax=Pseudomonas TaxID=286 RepID=A0AB35WWK4_9PSED|nr:MULTISPECIES: sel1 repeat family protein [unclassified Pseudomonas]MEE1867809.1 sel1 repeat family protein [Pseudomonas sp. 120P]MEE1960327.1 sel1 repeat family protein [Pseudomonas sp. 119P]
MNPVDHRVSRSLMHSRQTPPCKRFALPGASLLAAVLVVLAPVCVQAEGLQIDPHADLLYRQALTLLEQAESQNTSFSLKTSTTNQDLAQQGQNMGRTLAPAVGLLKKAVELDHPVARYRLALYYMTYLPADQIPDAACPLLEASVAQGFAPAALGIESWCPNYNQSAAFDRDLENVSAVANRYASYYPQPAERLLCNRTQPQGLAMQWGRQRDYQAEIYRLQGNGNPAQRQFYWRKAVDLNGCFAVQQRLLSSKH